MSFSIARANLSRSTLLCRNHHPRMAGDGSTIRARYSATQR